MNKSASYVYRAAYRSPLLTAQCVLRVLLTICVLLFLAAFLTFSFNPISVGLDPSWIAAIAEMQAQGKIFGKDIVFTAGPLSNMHNSYYEPVYATAMMAFRALYYFVYAGVLACLVRRQSIIGAVLLLLFFAGGVTEKDTLSLLYILIFTLASVSAGHWRPVLAIVGTINLAILVMAKFSNAPAIIVCLLLLDGLSLSRRKLPLNIAFFTAWCCIFAPIVGLPISEIPSYARAAIEAAAGYSEAMNKERPVMEILLWLIFAAVLTGFIARYEVMRIRSGGPLADSAVRALTFAALLFLSFKHGFVRHDGHALIAWLAIPAFAAAFAVVVRWADLGSRFRTYAVIFFVLISAFSQLAFYREHKAWPLASTPGLFVSAFGEFAELGRFVFLNGSWREAREAHRKDNVSRIANRFPLPKLEGSVEMIPNQQSVLIASDNKFTSRPTIQEYTTYSPSLIQRNSSYFAGPNSPDNILFAPAAIDGRLLALSEGAQWIGFLCNYEPVSEVHKMVLLKRRSTPLQNPLGPENVSFATFGEKVAVPLGAAPYFVKIKIDRNFAGSLANFVFKMPIMKLHITYADGGSESHRIIPGIAREGAILVPTLKSAGDFVRLASGEPLPEVLNRPVAFEVTVGTFGKMLYDGKIEWRFAPIDLEVLRAGAKGNSFIRTLLSRKPV